MFKSSQEEDILEEVEEEVNVISDELEDPTEDSAKIQLTANFLKCQINMYVFDSKIPYKPE